MTRREGNSRKKRVIAALAAVLLPALFLLWSAWALQGQEVVAEAPSLEKVDPERSQVLLTGEKYSLDKEQEQELLRQEEERREAKEEKEKKESKESAEENERAKRSETQRNSIVEEQRQGGNGGEGASSREGSGGGEGGGNGSGQGGGNGTGGEGEGDNGNGSNSGEETPEDNKNPLIECSLSDGQELKGSHLMFTLRGKDYAGRIIDSYYYSAWLDGAKLYSSGTDSSGYVTYRNPSGAPLSDGAHEVTVTVEDGNGHSSSVRYTVIADASAAELSDDEVTISVDLSHVGMGVILHSSRKIYEGENAATFVERALRESGFSPARGAGSDYYLQRIYGVIVDEESALEYVRAQYPQYADQLHEGSVREDSLGERDILATSGWMFDYNGTTWPSGLGSVTVLDGDEIRIWFGLDPLNGI